MGRKDLIARLNGCLDLAESAMRQALRASDSAKGALDLSMTTARDLIILAARVKALEERLSPPEQAMRSVIFDDLMDQAASKELARTFADHIDRQADQALSERQWLGL
jgi:hypothetical protein